MKIRCELTFNGETRKPYLVSGPSEPDDHLAHRIAAYILFWNDAPMVDATTRTPALANFEFLPDLLAVDSAGEAKLWIECGTVTMHKLTKVTRRMPKCRIVIIKETERAAADLRRDLLDQFDRPERVEILAWPGNSYKEWARTVGDSMEAFGESDGRSINGVVNEQMVVTEFKTY
ncbi:MAG: YaeQ family protein [Elusimicrobia bacterium]|nr:YaeQ family protein [Elusimicrobiota bacterium]